MRFQNSLRANSPWAQSKIGSLFVKEFFKESAWLSELLFLWAWAKSQSMASATAGPSGHAIGSSMLTLIKKDDSSDPSLSQGPIDGIHLPERNNRWQISLFLLMPTVGLSKERWSLLALDTPLQRVSVGRAIKRKEESARPTFQRQKERKEWSDESHSISLKRNAFITLFSFCIWKKEIGELRFLFLFIFLLMIDHNQRKMKTRTEDSRFPFLSPLSSTVGPHI